MHVLLAAQLNVPSVSCNLQQCPAMPVLLLILSPSAYLLQHTGFMRSMQSSLRLVIVIRASGSIMQELPLLTMWATGRWQENDSLLEAEKMLFVVCRRSATQPSRRLQPRRSQKVRPRRHAILSLLIGLTAPISGCGTPCLHYSLFAGHICPAYLGKG